MTPPSAREVMAFWVAGLFTYALYLNPDDKLILGALIASFSTAVGFYLGGSKVGSDTAAKNADTIAANASAALVTDAPQPINVAEVGGEPVGGKA